MVYVLYLDSYYFLADKLFSVFPAIDPDCIHLVQHTRREHSKRHEYYNNLEHVDNTTSTFDFYHFPNQFLFFQVRLFVLLLFDLFFLFLHTFERITMYIILFHVILSDFHVLDNTL